MGLQRLGKGKEEVGEILGCFNQSYCDMRNWNEMITCESENCNRRRFTIISLTFVCTFTVSTLTADT